MMVRRPALLEILMRLLRITIRLADQLMWSMWCARNTFGFSRPQCPELDTIDPHPAHQIVPSEATVASWIDLASIATL